MKKYKGLFWGIFSGGISLLTFAGSALYANAENKKPKSRLPATMGTKRDFIQAMRLAIGTQIPVPGLLLTIAWAAFESNWGRTTGFRLANNPWNITAGSKWTGPVVPGPDTEYDNKGNVKNITQQWRKYNTIADAVGDMVTFLTVTNSQYLAARDLLFKGDTSFTDSLAAGHYYTLPSGEYKAGVLSCLEDVKALAAQA